MGPLAAGGLAEAARVAVVPCTALAVLLLLVSTAVPVAARRLVVTLAGLIGVVGVVAYAVYLLNSP